MGGNLERVNTLDKSKILIVDDEARTRFLLRETLEDASYEVVEAADGYEALSLLRKSEIDIMLLDLSMPGMDGMQVIRRLKQMQTSTIVIILTAHGSIRHAVEATRMGVYDFLEKPAEPGRLLLTIKNALKNRNLQKENEALSQALFSEFEIIGASEKMQELRALIDRAAEAGVHVLITGSNGTGKDLVARNIHLRSPRRGQPFVMINCAAIPDTLIESELFGHEKGAFTSAVKASPGKFEIANHGTLFLNEIGEMKLELQAKLLQVIESRFVQRLGGHHEISLDVRIIAATNKNLQHAIRNGSFRQDLFFRLNVLPIHVPDLQNRQEDILPLFNYFMQLISKRKGIPAKSLAPAAIGLLHNYSWPGNVRELKFFVERLAILVDGPEILPEHVEKFLVIESDSMANKIPSREDHSLRRARERFEHDYILQVLQSHNWQIAKAAEYLRIDRTHLYKLIQKLRIVRGDDL
ncbi:MAG: sigma-54-dependent Fis family transcriptional regulator [Calditrichaeota bacterium]|nr:MAG: sigma-54-dependent Fis family transcriptional regulator [Calditrichota bacterium]